MPETDSGYLSKLRNFEDLFNERASVALTILGRESASSREINRYQRVFTAAVHELASLYTAKFVDGNVPPEKAAILTPLEANIAMATQQNLEIMRRMVCRSSGGSLDQVLLKRLSKWMARTTSGLESRGAIPFSLRISVPQLLQAGRKPLRTFGSLVKSSLLRKSMTALYDGLDPSNFLRTPDLRFEGIDSALDQLAKYPRRVLVIIANHDLGLYDGTIAQRLASLLGSQHHIVMTRKGVYPLPPPANTGDVVYVDEDNPKYRPVADSVGLVRGALKDAQCVTLAMYPEGMMPFTGAQMPLITKDGGHIIARKLAIELAGSDTTVLVIEANSNMLSHLTGREVFQPSLTISSIMAVPATPFNSRGTDEWAGQARRETERRFNADRGVRMLNILCAKPLPGSMTYEAEPLGVLSARVRVQ